MVITYCEACGVRVELTTLPKRVLCDACKAGKKPRRRIRDSGAISRKKLDESQKLSRSKQR